MSIPIRCHNKRHFMLLLLLRGIEPNPGSRPPKYPCGVCKKAVKNMGQRALACVDCDKWCHKSCLEMNTIEFDELANNSLPWYCPSCNSLNRTTVVYDLPTVDYCAHIVNSTSIQPQTPAKSDGSLTHSSTGSSGIIDSSISLSSIEQQSSILATNISNSEHDESWGSLGSPAVASSPKPKPIHQQGTVKHCDSYALTFRVHERKERTFQHLSNLFNLTLLWVRKPGLVKTFVVVNFSIPH